MSSKFATCPGLFQPSAAQDGLLVRLRVPGGLLTVAQCDAIADLADQAGGGYVEVTNRANVQIRELQASLDMDQLARLQAVGLASSVAAVDALRNIMCSPTAGIDCQQLLDTRPFVSAWNRYLTARPDFAVLSPKFSVCFDGGESVSVRDRPNDISFVAVAIADTVYFRLHLNLGDRGAPPCAVNVFIKPEESLPALIAMTEVYRDYTIQKLSSSSQRKPRLRELLHDWSLATYLQAVAQRLPFLFCQSEEKLLLQREKIVNSSLSDTYDYLGIHPQHQPERSYIGCVLPLGRLKTKQLRGLARLASQYSGGMLRLTPWQNVLLADVPSASIAAVQQEIAQLGLSQSATHPHGAIVACSGTTGCKASATNTQANALELAAHLEQFIALDRPINIHFSGCEKSCAQHHASDMTLLGMTQNGRETYHIYLGDDGSNVGRSLYQHYLPTQLPVLIEHILRVYQQRSHSQESFGNFVNRFTIAELQKMFRSSPDCDLLGAREQH